jgi:hypothetical protein
MALVLNLHKKTGYLENIKINIFEEEWPGFPNLVCDIESDVEKSIQVLL